MQKFKIPATTLLILIALYFIHIQGMAYHLYMRYWYYDIISHFMAGIAVALSAYSIADLLNIQFIKKNMRSLILITLVAGIAWEMFEVYYDIAGYELGTLAYQLDTIKDIFNDILGSVLVCYVLDNKK